MYSCACGAEKASKPCYLSDWHCAKPCGKTLACGRHHCELICHSGRFIGVAFALQGLLRVMWAIPVLVSARLWLSSFVAVVHQDRCMLGTVLPFISCRWPTNANPGSTCHMLDSILSPILVLRESLELHDVLCPGWPLNDQLSPADSTPWQRIAWPGITYRTSQAAVSWCPALP